MIIVCPQCHLTFEENDGASMECLVGGHWTPHSSSDQIPMSHGFPLHCCHQFQKQLDTTTPDVGHGPELTKPEATDS